ncbi:MAG: hypothetical protein M3R58_11090 [Pseudomonadota bacterium]|nr:hypothetical protein [Pseudomonadota bacterium]
MKLIQCLHVKVVNFFERHFQQDDFSLVVFHLSLLGLVVDLSKDNIAATATDKGELEVIEFAKLVTGCVFNRLLNESDFNIGVIHLRFPLQWATGGAYKNINVFNLIRRTVKLSLLASRLTGKCCWF